MVLIGFNGHRFREIVHLGYLRGVFSCCVISSAGIDKTWRRAWRAVSFFKLTPRDHYTCDLASLTPCCSAYLSCSLLHNLNPFPSQASYTISHIPPIDCPYTYFYFRAFLLTLLMFTLVDLINNPTHTRLMRQTQMPCRSSTS